MLSMRSCFLPIIEVKYGKLEVKNGKRFHKIAPYSSPEQKGIHGQNWNTFSTNRHSFSAFLAKAGARRLDASRTGAYLFC